jgi:hypothetical protein
LQRSNGSNLGSALVDSLVFPTLAFGGFNVVTTVLQFCAKLLGGFVWSLLLVRYHAASSATADQARRNQSGTSGVNSTHA